MREDRVHIITCTCTDGKIKLQIFKNPNEKYHPVGYFQLQINKKLSKVLNN